MAKLNRYGSPSLSISEMVKKSRKNLTRDAGGPSRREAEHLDRLVGGWVHPFPWTAAPAFCLLPALLPTRVYLLSKHQSDCFNA